MLADEGKALDSDQYQAENYPGFSSPLTHRHIDIHDAMLLAPVMRRSSKNLRGFIGWAKYANTWNLKNVQKFVSDHVKADGPRAHYLFFIGKEVVGFGSLAPMPNPYEIQVALWVAEGYQSKGIGTKIVQTLEWQAAVVWGYWKIYYQHDANNQASCKLAKRLGYRYDHTFESPITANDESGFWISWSKDRNQKLGAGILQGFPHELWTDPDYCRRRMLETSGLILYS